jgi:putative phosphoribosyl transferase
VSLRHISLPPRRVRAPRFANRRAAGVELAKYLSRYAGHKDLVVLGLPRGGVPVAFEVAASLLAPLDVLSVRKLGVPQREELAFGAIASGGVVVLNQAVLAGTRLSASAIEQVLAAERHELERREQLYRGDRSPPEVSGLTAIAVDDGLATGATMHAAIQALRKHGVAEVVVAVPIAARETYQEIGLIADAVVCPYTPEPFVAVGLWYRDFTATTDAEVGWLLEQARTPHQP